MLPTKEQLEKEDNADRTNTRFDDDEKLPLFVIGAGASIEFGYPNGDELKMQIKEILDTNNLDFHDINLTSLCKKEKDEQKLIDACNTINKKIDHFQTVDGCIRFYSEFNEYVKSVGNFAIAKAILNLEFNKDSLFSAKNALRTEDHWLKSFFQFVTKHLSESDVKVRIPRIPIMTFNYERNIEKYLDYMSILLFESNSDLSKYIEHMYGSLPKESEFAKENYSLLNWSKEIETYTERINLYPHVRNCNPRIYEAESIVFLGFGYDTVNMKLLSRIMNQEKKKKVFGTAYKIDKNLKENLTENISKTFNVDKNDIKLYDTTCKDFFNKFSSIEDLK
ncbi:MAG: hypothetical protein FWB90_03985 [Fibromonadales bacterium]|nr:hypothetical protein [Fibromonadales bacterium]